MVHRLFSVNTKNFTAEIVIAYGLKSFFETKRVPLIVKCKFRYSHPKCGGCIIT